jgi:hypothetical protein
MFKPVFLRIQDIEIRCHYPPLILSVPWTFVGNVRFPCEQAPRGHVMHAAAARRPRARQSYDVRTI